MFDAVNANNFNLGHDDFVIGEYADDGGESHRIHWQYLITTPRQHLASSDLELGKTLDMDGTNKSTQSNSIQSYSDRNSGSNSQRSSEINGSYRCDIVTSSEVIRLTSSSRASDVTDFMRLTMQLGALPNEHKDQVKKQEFVEDYGMNAKDMEHGNPDCSFIPRRYTSFWQEDCLVLVGTVNVSRDCTPKTCSTSNNCVVSKIPDSKTKPLRHVVKTLDPNDSPLAVREKMKEYLKTLELKQELIQQSHDENQPIENTSSRHRMVFPPQLQWYYVPVQSNLNQTIHLNTALSSQIFVGNSIISQSFFPNYIHLDGCCASMDEDDDFYDENEVESQTKDDNKETNSTLRDIGVVYMGSSCTESLVQSQKNHSNIGHPWFHQHLRKDNFCIEKQSPTDAFDEKLSNEFPWITEVNSTESKIHQCDEDVNTSNMGMMQLHGNPTCHFNVNANEDFIHEQPSIPNVLKRLIRHQIILKEQQESALCPKQSIVGREWMSSVKPSLQAVLLNYPQREHETLSGYLLKRDNRDVHVWRQVYCVVSDDDIWYNTRVFNYVPPPIGHDKLSVSPMSNRLRHVHFTKNGRINLTRALILVPSINYLPLFRIPYAFELVSACGTSHLFRAYNTYMQTLWTRVISERIVQSYENSLMSNAELIIADEYNARNKRVTTLASQPLWNHINDHKYFATATDGDGGNFGNFTNSLKSHSLHCNAYSSLVGTVMRWGIQVAEYKECCRYVQSILPAKNPVVVADTATSSSSVLSSSHHQSNAPVIINSSRFFSFKSTIRGQLGKPASTSKIPTTSPTVEPMDRTTRDMIRAAWDTATILLARATHIAFTLEQQHLSTSKLGLSSHNHVETLCRHVDYVITGRFRPLAGPVRSDSVSGVHLSSSREYQQSGNSSENMIRSSIGEESETDGTFSKSNQHLNQETPPPADLFDPLLAELQKLAASADLLHSNRQNSN